MLAEGKDVYARYGYTPDFRTIGGFFETFEKRGHARSTSGRSSAPGTLRDFVIGNADRRATPEELAKMADLVDQAMKDGALGVSTSLQYVPDMYNSTDEIIAMAKVAARYGGAYFTHQRSEANAIDSSLDEVFRIAKEAGIRSADLAPEDRLQTQLGQDAGGPRPHRGRPRRGHRRRGQPVSLDRRLQRPRRLPAAVDPRGRPRGAAEAPGRPDAAREGEEGDARGDRAPGPTSTSAPGGPDRVLVASVVNAKLKPYEGKTIAQIAAEEKKDPRDALIDLVIADRANIACIIFMMDENDVRTALKSPLVAFCTDSGAGATDGIFSEEKSHPARLGLDRAHPRPLRARREGRSRSRRPSAR